MWIKFNNAINAFALRWCPPLMVLNIIICTHSIVSNGYTVARVLLWILGVFYLTLWCDRNSEFLKIMENND